MWRRFRVDVSAKPITSEELPDQSHVILRELTMWRMPLPGGWKILYETPEILLGQTFTNEHLWLYIKEPD